MCTKKQGRKSNSNMKNKLPKDEFGLDSIDYNILSYIINQRSSAFILHRSIQVKIEELVKKIYSVCDETHYKITLDRIYRLSGLKYVHVEYQDQQGSTNKNQEDILKNFKKIEIGGFYDNILYTSTGHLTGDMSVEMNYLIHKQFLNRQLYRAYKKELNSLDNRASVVLLDLLKSRIDAYRLNKRMLSVSLNDFQKKMVLNPRAENQNKEVVRKALSDISRRTMLNLKYTESKDVFFIEFDEIKEREFAKIVEATEYIKISELLPPKEGILR